MKEGGSDRVHELVNELEEELEKHHDKEEGKSASITDAISKVSDTQSLITTKTDDGENKEAMSLLKGYFSGPEGLKRSVSFIKFADLLSSSPDSASSLAQNLVQHDSKDLPSEFPADDNEEFEQDDVQQESQETTKRHKKHHHKHSKAEDAPENSALFEV